MLKSIIFLPCLLFAYHFSFDQSTPVSWTFSARKLDDKKYEITLSASVQPTWHIYSQHTPEGGPIPTKITFNKNPLVTAESEIRESGKKVTKYEDVFDVNVIYFEGQTSFVQVINLKSKVKTTLSGKIEYMVCNDTECLPPVEVPFLIALK